MKRGNACTAAVVFTALTIIGCCASSMFACRKRKIEQRGQLEIAEQAWESEGGAVRPEPEEALA